MRINDQIRVPRIRLIYQNRNMGVVPISDAKTLARDSGLDLVEIAPDSKPPVCKIIDFGKWQYEQGKREKANKTKPVAWKEVRLSAGTQKHDIDTKGRCLRQFLASGQPVKVSVHHKKRQIVHPDQGRHVMEEILAFVEGVGKVESKPRMEGRDLSVRIVPQQPIQE